jgi:hypothetical protein
MNVQAAGANSSQTRHSGMTGMNSWDKPQLGPYFFALRAA